MERKLPGAFWIASVLFITHSLPIYECHNSPCCKEMNMASVTHSPRINKTLLNSSYGNGKYRRPRALLSVSVPVGTELRSEIQTSLWLSLTMASASNSVFGTGTWAKQFQKWSSNRTAGTRGHGRGRTLIWSHTGMGRPCGSETVPHAVKPVSYIPVIFVLRKYRCCITAAHI